MVSALEELIAAGLGGERRPDCAGMASPWYTHCALSQLRTWHVPLFMVISGLFFCLSGEVWSQTPSLGV